MSLQDRAFTVETDHATYPAVITARALQKLNGHVEMFSWGALVHRYRERIYQSALRKYETSGLDARGRIVVGPDDLLCDDEVDRIVEQEVPA